MRRLLLFGLLLFAVVSIVSGQAVGINIQGTNFTGTFRISPEERVEKILGNPYLSRDYMYGKLVLNDGNSLEALFRYNVYGQELELVWENDTFGISAPFSVAELNMSNKRFIHSLYLEREYNVEYLSSAFFEVIYEGEAQLLIQHRCEIENNSYSTNYMGGGGDGRDYYVQKTLYYFKPGPGTAAKRFNRTKKDIISLFPDRQREIRAYIKDQKINPRSDEELIALVKYYEELD